MEDNVKYQIERAEDALRTALNLGSAKEDPYLLRNIAETISTISGWKRSFSNNSPRYNIPSKSYPVNVLDLTKTSIPNITISTAPDSTPSYYPTMGVGGSTDTISLNSYNIPNRF